ncbi:50S ribosomal protein L24 [bacterium]|nr:50S ribosomal protein L24 [bacterium]
MKFQVGDQVVVTSGKDKGRKAKVTRVLPRENAVVVEGTNMYTRHIRKMMGQPGQTVRRERPLSTAKVAIVNDSGQADRIGYKMVDGKKQRVYKKTGTVITSKA